MDRLRKHGNFYGLRIRLRYRPNAKTEAGTLQAGNYSLKVFESQIRIERKSLQDLLCSLGVDRERFMREIQKSKALEYCALVIESHSS